MKKNKILAGIMILVLSISLITACSKETDESTGSTDSQTTDSTESTTSGTSEDTTTSAAQTVSLDTIEYDEEDYYQEWDSDSVTYINGSGSSVQVEGGGATADGNLVTISAKGTYVISDQITDGQIIVNASEEDIVRIILNGAEISSLDSSPIYGISAEKIIVSIEDGTTNSLTDGNEYQLADGTTDEPNAALFSKSDITINGYGSLTVNGNYNNGITSKDDLIIMSGNFTINAVDDGIIGKDSVVIKEGVFTITAGGDGIKATNDTDTGKGFVAVEGGTYHITSGTDGIQAATAITTGGGNYAIITGGGSINGTNNSNSEKNTGSWGNTPASVDGTSSATLNGTSSSNTIDDSTSAKALKAGADISILGGEFTIDSKDDALHSNNNISINNGTLTITSGDDGIHADSTIDIAGGTIDIKKSYEGIESSIITVDGGTIHVVASDDGINVAGGNDSSSVSGRPGQNSFQSTGNNSLTINNGYIYVDSSGDGLDANGSLYMNGGTVIVNGPTNSGNASVDYDSEFLITGGFLISAGSSGMAQTPETQSEQASIAYTFTQAQQAGSLIHLEDENGTTLVTFSPAKDYQWILISSPELKQSANYHLYTGGSATGDVTDGIYSNENYQGGTLVTEYTISEMVTWLSESGEVTAGAFNPGGGFGGKQGGRPAR
jgi:hypothetical protein